MNRLSAGLLVLIAIGFCGESSPAGPRTIELRDAAVYANQSFGFRAHQSATGEITGYIVSNSSPDYSAPFVIEGRVSCLRVLGNRATMGGVLERLGGDEFPSPRLYRGWYLYVEDNVGRGVPDRVGHQWLSEDPVTTCRTPGLPTSWSLEIIEGDVSVIEGPR